MTEDDRPVFKQQLQVLCAAFRQEPSVALYEAYWIGTQRMTTAELAAAVRRAIESCEFMPSAAELRSINAPVRSNTGIYTPANKVLESIQRCNYHGSHTDKAPEHVWWCKTCQRLAPKELEAS